MRVKGVYCIFDTVSDTVLGEFIANNEAVAIKSFKNFLDKEKDNLDMNDIKLFKLGEYTSCSNADELADCETATCIDLIM